MGDYSARPTVLVLLGLLWCTVAIARLARSEGLSSDRLRSAAVTATLPAVGLVLAGFFGTSFNTLWGVAVLLATLLFFALSVLAVDQLVRTSQLPPSAAYAMVSSTSVLYGFGALLQIRLSISRDPNSTFGADLDLKTLQTGFLSFSPPLMVVAAVVGLVFLVTSEAARPVALRRLLARPSVVRLGSLVAAHWFAVTALMIGGLFALPLVGPSTGDVHLYFLGIALPEFGKPLLFGAASVVMVRHRYDFGRWVRSGTSTPLLWRAQWHTVLGRPVSWVVGGALAAVLGVVALVVRDGLGPGVVARGIALGAVLLTVSVVVRVFVVRDGIRRLVVLGLVAAVPSAARQDFGTLIPVAAAAVAMLTTFYLLGDRSWAGTKTSLKRYRPTAYLAAGALVLLAVIAIFVGYGTRFAVWSDPWKYGWNAECVQAEPALQAAAPPGMELCVTTQAEVADDQKSQVAKGLFVIADGGLWGRGLQSIDSRLVAANDTDFVIASLWSKLGGLVVLGVLLLLTLWGRLALAVTGMRWGQGDRDAATLAGAAVAGAIIGQTFFVLLATLAILPHSGIPLPLVSRAGQPNGGLVIAVWMVLLMVAWTKDNRPPARPRYGPVAVPQQADAVLASPLSGRSLAVLASVLTAFLAYATVVPYNAWLGSDWSPLSFREGLKNSDVQERIASRGTMKLTLSDGSTYRLDREGSEWVPGRGAVDPIVLEGLLAPQAGGFGWIDGHVQSLFASVPQPTLRDRLLPARTPGVPELDLTLNGVLQVKAEEWIRETVGGMRFPTGLLVMDATSNVLAAASTPDVSDIKIPEPDLGQIRSSVFEVCKADGDQAAQDRLQERLAGLDRNELADKFRACSNYRPLDDQVLGGDAQACFNRFQCGKLGLQRLRAPRKPPMPAYAPAGKQQPSPYDNWVYGKRFGPASTMKIVVSAAYLRAGGRMSDRVPAPSRVAVSATRSVGNVYNGLCPGTVAGTLTVAQALAVSCNTPFVLIARDLGWPRIRDMALKFGFRVDSEDRTNQVPRDSLVAQNLYGGDLVNAVLGGAGVDATPVQMATVVSTVARGGVRVSPNLVRSARDQHGRDVELQKVRRSRVLTAEEAAQLRDALGLAGQGDGTLAGLASTDGPALFGKTGTQVLGGGKKHRYVQRVLWIVGFLDTQNGPVSFAVVVESPDTKTGREHARTVVARLAAGIGLDGTVKQ